MRALQLGHLEDLRVGERVEYTSELDGVEQRETLRAHVVHLLVDDLGVLVLCEKGEVVSHGDRR